MSTTFIAKQKKCRHCKTLFTPVMPMQIACGIECAKAIAKKKREKVEKANDRQKRESLKSRAQWAREAQAEANKYVRLRDDKEPCISCGRYHQGQWHAGHYLSRGAHPELALIENNIHKQCQPCNVHLSGNQIEYRKGLIARYGVEYVEWLEGPHDPAKHSIDDLKAIKAAYMRKTKELRESETA